MNCNKCQDLLSDFLAGTLEGDDHGLLSTHLEECLSCVDVRREMQTLVAVAREIHGEEIAPPDSRALWLRIRNSVEIERETEQRMAAASTVARRPANAGEGFWSRMMGRRWELSLPQLTASVAVLAIVVAAATAFGVRGLGDTTGQLASGAATTGNRVAIASDALSHETYLQQQQMKRNYWKQRVEVRKASWNPQMRVSFEKSMNAYEETIKDAVMLVERNPHDEVAKEFLNAALRKEMELLRGFSDQ